MRIAAVILNWCDPEATIHCVDTLMEHSMFGGGVHVVDNASPDNSYEVLKTRLPACRVFRNVMNSGYTGGNNYGLEQAFKEGCDAVLILNNDIDVHLTPAFWAWLDTTLSSSPNSLIGIPVSRNQRADDFSFPASHGLVTRAIVAAAGVDIRRMPDLICGCAMVIPRDLYESIGLFNEDFFMYCEEFDYALRAARAQGTVIHSPAELGFVVREESFGDRAPYVYYYQARNLMAIALSCPSPRKWRVTFLVMMVSLWNAVKARRPHYVKAAALGVLHGLWGKRGRLAVAHSWRIGKSI